eukprot:3278248-Pyramimonas_sp.AAC.1
MWCRRWILPLFKKGSAANPDHYRGLQVTSQVSKVVGRLLGALALPRLDRVGARGPSQCAYRRERGARGAIL